MHKSQALDAYDECYAKSPRRMEWYGLGMMATECVWKEMKSQGFKHLRKKVGWSKKKWTRVMEGDITLKQLSHLLFALGFRAEIKIKPIPEKLRKLINFPVH